MSNILIIIDMQRWFLRHNGYNSVISNCIKEIEVAKENNEKIIFLQYEGAGKVLRELTQAAGNYEQVFFAYKNIEDGSSWVKDILDYYFVRPNAIKVAGVQTDLCVYNTIEGLRFLYPKTKLMIIQNACGAQFDNEHIYGLRKINKISNTMII